MVMFIVILIKALELYRWILLARIICSWLPGANWYNQPLKFLYDITEPVMGPFRRLIPPLGMLDISPIVLFLVIDALLIPALRMVGGQMLGY